jgi:hypothetical protein
MAEIDNYSKYQKYKQKYLKEKNLQFGGNSIIIKIIVKQIVEEPQFGFNTNVFTDIKFDKSDNVKDKLIEFLRSNGINIDIFKVVTLTGREYSIKNLTKSFEENNINNGNTIIITQIKKIKINIVVKKIDKIAPVMFQRSFYENIEFNKSDKLYIIFKYLINLGILEGNIFNINEDYDVLCDGKPIILQINFLENGILDGKTITIREKKRIKINIVVKKINKDNLDEFIRTFFEGEYFKNSANLHTKLAEFLRLKGINMTDFVVYLEGNPQNNLSLSKSFFENQILNGNTIVIKEISYIKYIYNTRIYKD